MQTFQIAGQTVALPETLRENLAQDAAAIMLREINPRSVYVFDSGVLLPTAGTADDLGFYQGTHGTDVPYIGTGDVKNTTTSRKCRFTFSLPPEYVAGGAVIILARAGMKTTVASTTATIDFTAYKANGTVITGTDLVETVAQSINSITFDDIAFSLTPTGLLPGDEFDVVCTVDIADTATATAVIGAFRLFYGCTSRG